MPRNASDFLPCQSKALSLGLSTNPLLRGQYQKCEIDSDQIPSLLAGAPWA